MSRSDRRGIAFLFPADAVKADVVAERLLSGDRFTDRYEVAAVLDGARGRVVETLRREDVPYVVASDPRHPGDAVDRAAAELPSFDYLVSCGWTELIPPAVIDRPEAAALNCHGSYLPNYKGPAMHRVQWANGERRAGVTVHHLAEEFDAGDIVCRERFTVSLTDTPLDILRKTADLTPALLREALLLLEDGHDGVPNEGGEYFSLVPWPKAVAHGVVNRALWALGSDRRVPIEPE